MPSDILWNNEEPITNLGIEVPRWIAQDIDPATIAAIVQGGCAGGAYMPAVTYHEALAMMNERGDEVLQYLDEHDMNEVMSMSETLRGSWAAVAVYFLSAAVELWAGSVEEEIREKLEEREQEAEEA